MRKCGKMMLRLELAKGRQKIFCHFFKCSISFRAHALQSELNKVSMSNFVKFQLQRINSKIRRAFDKMTKCSIKIGLKRTIIWQLNGPYINVKFLT